MKASLIKIQQIWNHRPHNGFTDLIRYQNQWICAFREGSSHMSLDGQVRLISSSDGQNWQSFALLDWVGGDVRDPKLSLMPDGALWVTVGVRLAAPVSMQQALFSTAWIFQENQNIIGPVLSSQHSNTWRWSPTWFKNTAYSIGYAGKDRQGCLYASQDGQNWTVIKAPFFESLDCYANEASLVFDAKTGDAQCLLRRDWEGCNGLLGHAKAPFTDWTWRELPMALGGPKLIQLLNGAFVAAFRIIENDQAKTHLYQIFLDGSVNHLLEFPSDGDTSYPGLVEFEQHLWISYYSSHEEQTAIYFAQVSLI